MFEEEKKPLLTNLDKVNYYNEKIKENILICRIRLFIYILLFIFLSVFMFPFLDDNTKEIVFGIYIFSFLIWWLITFISRKKLLRKMFESSCDDSFVECKKCKNYKYLNKKCDICGDDYNLSNSEVVELLNKYSNKRKIIFAVCFIIIFLIAIAEIKIVLSIYENENYLFSLYFFTLGNPSIFYVFLVIVGLIASFFIIIGAVSLANKYIAKSNLLISDNPEISEMYRKNKR